MPKSTIRLFCMIFATTILIPTPSEQFYTNSSHVIELTEETFYKRVLHHEDNPSGAASDIWVVQFYVKQCPTCKTFIPEYERAAKALQKFLHCGAVNVALATELIRKYNIDGYPKIKYFNHVANGILDYSFSEPTASGVIFDAMKAIRKKVDDNMRTRLVDSKSVLELDDECFDRDVLQAENAWLLVFYDNEDAHRAETLREAVGAVQMAMLKSMRIGAVSAKNLYARSVLDVHDFPAIVFLPFGVSLKRVHKKFDGIVASENVLDFVKWQHSNMPITKPPGTITQLDGDDSFNTICTKSTVCLVLFLPDLKTFPHEKRENYYAMLTEEIEEHKYADWVWTWVEFGRLPDVEIVLDVADGPEPVLSAVENEHKAHLLLKGPFSKGDLRDFLQNVRVGFVDLEHVFVDDIYKDSEEIKDEL